MTRERLCSAEAENATNVKWHFVLIADFVAKWSEND